MKNPFVYILLLAFLTGIQSGCKKDDPDDENNNDNGQKTQVTFTIGDETYKLHNGNATVTDTYIQVVATKTESDEDYTFQMHLPGGVGVWDTDEFNFNCGKDIAYCANETSVDFGADLVIEITQTNPGLKGVFYGKVVQCMTANPPVKEIVDGVIEFDEEDVLRY